MNLITLGIATYGAIFSTISIIFSIYFAIKTHKPSIQVRLSEGFLVGKNYEDKNTYLFINAGNNSTRNIRLNTVGFLYKGKIFQIPYPLTLQTFPCELKDGDSFSCWITTKNVAEGLRKNNFGGKVKIKGFFSDALGNRYCSKPYKFDSDKWL